MPPAPRVLPSHTRGVTRQNMRARARVSHRRQACPAGRYTRSGRIAVGSGGKNANSAVASAKGDRRTGGARRRWQRRAQCACRVTQPKGLPSRRQTKSLRRVGKIGNESRMNTQKHNVPTTITTTILICLQKWKVCVRARVQCKGRVGV